MLVSAKAMLDKAKAGHYAVGAFNINDLEWAKAILTAAQECKSPVILQVSEGAGKYMVGRYGKRYAGRDEHFCSGCTSS